jgi:hypothetical protein
VGAVIDSPNVMRRARAIYIEKDMFALVTGVLRTPSSSWPRTFLKDSRSDKSFIFWYDTCKRKV